MNKDKRPKDSHRDKADSSTSSTSTHDRLRLKANEHKRIAIGQRFTQLLALGGGTLTGIVTYGSTTNELPSKFLNSNIFTGAGILALGGFVAVAVSSNSEVKIEEGAASLLIAQAEIDKINAQPIAAPQSPTNPLELDF